MCLHDKPLSIGKHIGLSRRGSSLFSATVIAKLIMEKIGNYYSRSGPEKLLKNYTKPEVLEFTPVSEFTE